MGFPDSPEPTPPYGRCMVHRSASRPVLRLHVAVLGVVAIALVATGCGSGTSSADADTSTTVTAAAHESPTTMTQGGADGAGVATPTTHPGGSADLDSAKPEISSANVCSFVPVELAESLTGVTGLVTSVTAGSGEPPSVICKLANPAEPPNAYGTVNFIALPDVGADQPVLQGLPGGTVTDPDPQGASLPATAGRSQTTVTWTYKGKQVEVNARGPKVTDDNVIALARSINDNLHGR